MPSLPVGFTECEVYRGFVIAVRHSVPFRTYCGFGPKMDTRNCMTSNEVRHRIDELLA